jgi:ergothioneine biosynthesis protein EgtB
MQSLHIDRPEPTIEPDLARRFLAIRTQSTVLCAPLEPEDYVLQSMPDASPAKWHLAHTTWFFETFVLSQNIKGYEPYERSFGYLFNSYYNAIGDRLARSRRGLISRPTVREVIAYRERVDREIIEFIRSQPLGLPISLIELGLNHEQQHQELIITDLKHAFAQSPLRPAYHRLIAAPSTLGEPVGLAWHDFPEGVHWIGFDGPGFAFDNESPRHRQFIEAFHLADRPSTNREYLAFMDDGGYSRPEFWLSDGWAARNALDWTAPLYWERATDGAFQTYTLAGMKPLQLDEPVTHLSYYEADAFARWSEARLPTEAEWETAALDSPIAGNLLESGRLHPFPAKQNESTNELRQLFGDVWEWTASPYTPYPGFHPASGAVGEYNGKFMCNQFVLRGGSCATPVGHIRPTYRNFFPPDARWQFSGVRLARDHV